MKSLQGCQGCYLKHLLSICNPDRLSPVVWKGRRELRVHQSYPPSWMQNHVTSTRDFKCSKLQDDILVYFIYSDLKDQWEILTPSDLSSWQQLPLDEQMLHAVSCKNEVPFLFCLVPYSHKILNSSVKGLWVNSFISIIEKVFT